MKARVLFLALAVGIFSIPMASVSQQKYMMGMPNAEVCGEEEDAAGKIIYSLYPPLRRARTQKPRQSKRGFFNFNFTSQQKTERLFFRHHSDNSVLVRFFKARVAGIGYYFFFVKNDFKIRK